MEGLLIGLTAAVVALTIALIIYSKRSIHSSEKLRKAVEELQKVEEGVSEIGLTQIGATLERTATIPKSFLGEDLEILKGNMSVLKPPKVRWTWDEDTLNITFRLNKLPEVLLVLQANARKPELILQRLASDPISVLLIRSYAQQQEMAKELLQTHLKVNQK